MEKKTDGLKYCGLDRLPTSILEEIIRSDLEDEEKYDSELIEYVLTLLAERKREENSEEIPDVQQSWMELQEQLVCEGMLEAPIQPLSTERKKTSGRRKKVLRYAAAAAACFAVMCTALITAQAGGLNVFGVIASWTDDSFYFSKTEDPAGDDVAVGLSTQQNRTIKEALSEAGLPTEFAPTWVPDDYQLMSVDILHTDFMLCVYAVYDTPKLNKNCTVNIEEYYSEEFLYNGFYEKDDFTPKVHTANGRTFYVFSNSGTWTATWTDGRYCITIAGASSEEMVVEMIDSIS